jgi:hypothetical protein
VKIKYPLDPLLKKRGWDVDFQKGQLAVQRALVERLKNDYLLSAAICKDQINRIESMLAEKTLPLSRYEIERAYVPELLGRMEVAKLEWQESLELEEKMRMELGAVLRDLQISEEHKKKFVRQAQDDEKKREFKEADEQWLLNGSGRSAA